MKPGTITSTLVAIVVSLQLISLLGVKQATELRLHNQAKLLAVHELDTKAKTLVIQVQQFLSPITSQLSISRQLFVDGLLSTEKNRTLERYFLSQLRANKSMSSMYLGRYDGSFVAVTRFEESLITSYDKPVFRAKISSATQNNTRNVEWREYTLHGEELKHWAGQAEGYDPRQREWYVNAKVHDRPVWTNAYSSTDSQNLSIAASVNLRDMTNDDAGVLGVSVDLTQLSALISRTPLSDKASLFIFDNSFNQIAPSIRRSTQTGGNATKHTAESLWDEKFVEQRSRRFLPPIDTPGNRLSAVDRQWYSHNDTQANVLRGVHLFDGALRWRILLRRSVLDLKELNKSVMLEGMYPTMAIIVLPGLLALVVIFALKTPLQRLHRSATVDYLTKALNREEFVRRFSKRLDKADHGSGAKNQWVAVALDLDGFKRINDQYGHHAGDDILKTVVTRLQQNVGRPGFVGRLGGDEFAIALKLRSDDDVLATVERVRQLVVSAPVQSAHVRHHIGMTAGVALASCGESAVDLLQRADNALVSGKLIAKNASYRATDCLQATSSAAIRAVVPREISSVKPVEALRQSC
ncbi:MAG: diguanylate cyclase [Granulosicoccus sp.]